MTDLPEVFAYVQDHRGRPHYGRHIEPVALALMDRGHKVTRLRPGQAPPNGSFVIVASATDAQTLGPTRKVIYVEHGAGQSYNGDGGGQGKRGYPGGEGCDNVVLFLTPNDQVAAAWEARYDAATAVVGCPALDRWHSDGNVTADMARPRIAFTFHWPSMFAPEAGTAWPTFKRSIEERVIPRALNRGWALRGHWHPRWGDQLRDEWQIMGITASKYDTVMSSATLLVADNTSMIPEFASTGRPVLFLNSPDWRRDVDHGGRFWSWVGDQVECDNPLELPDLIDEAIADTLPRRQSREAMVRSVYAHTDGKASERAADAIEALLGAAT